MAQMNTPQGVLNFINQLNNVTLNDAQIRLGIVFSHEVEYQRFNPILLRAVLWSRERTKDEELFRTDQMKLLVFILTRGTNYEKAKLNLPGEAKTTMEELIRKYEIKIDPNVETGSRGTNARRNRLKETDVTLGRISACWPQWTAQLLAQAESGPLLKWVNLAPGVPSYLCFPQSASIVPVTDTVNLAHCRNFYNEFDKTINRKVVRDDTYNMFRDQFFETIKDSPLFSNDERVALLDRLQVMSQNKIVAIVNQNKTFATILNTIAGLDPNAPVHLDDQKHGQSVNAQPRSNAAQMAAQQRQAAQQQRQQQLMFQQQQQQQQQQMQQQPDFSSPQRGGGVPVAPSMSATSTVNPFAQLPLTRMTSPATNTQPFTTTPNRVTFQNPDDQEDDFPRMAPEEFARSYRQAEFNQVPPAISNPLSAIGLTAGFYSLQQIQLALGREVSPQEYGVRVDDNGTLHFHLPL